ncbi:Aminopeptidase [Mycena venus]|uniref:Aminopeptidase n=1 Tax=Mycena venus TaxID=2733690 RepID=A0A8H7DC15_9AGAR|nr:Aminopeptidase [Mycena venus]
MDSASLDTYRLPTDVVPIHYDLKVRTDLKDLVFDGAVTITIRFSRDTSNIVLNVFELELGSSTLVFESKTLDPTDQSINTDTQRVALSFAKVFPAGTEAALRMTFRGKISGGSGYFKSEWVHDGVTKHYSGAFFEPTYARRAFPCWDEPALKATFAVSLISRAGTVNLSNMPAYFEGSYDPAQDPLEPSFGTGKDTAEWITTRFETTPKMSTYIVAYANGPFAHVESSFTSALTGKIRPVRIYATPDLIEQAHFPLELTTKVLPMLEKMFDLEYPLPKMDILCANGALGALENWGLIIGDPGAFLFDPKTGATATKKRVVDITSHELAHQWFGNIVTMEWWDNLWLNEGKLWALRFATLLGSIISEKLHPEWNTSAATVNNTFKYGLNMDARLSSHPVQVECPDANNVHEIMDVIAYMKGSSLLRMVSSLLGEEVFFKGVAVYLKERQFGNSVAEDLWDALGRTSGTDVLNLMKNWISETGYPVLTVTEGPGGINVRQNRFLASGVAEAKDDETLWTVPLSLLTVDSAGNRSIDKTIFLSEREQFIPLDTSWPFKLNASSTGFYRVLYQSEKLNKLALEAAKGNISDMSGLMNDVMALAKADLAKLSSALTLMNGFAGTTEYIVLAGIAANIDSLLDAWWENPTIVEQLQSLDRHIFVPLVSKLGYEYHSGESTDTAAVRTLAVKRAAYARDPRVLTELQTRFSSFMADAEASPLPPDLVPAIYTVAVRHGGRKEYDHMWEILQTTKSPAEEGHAALAVAAAEDPDLMAKTFDRLLKENDSKVDWLMSGLSAYPKSRRPMVQFLKDHYDALHTRFETSGFEHYVMQPFRLLATAEDYEDMVAFFKTKDTSKFARSLEQTLEAIQTNIKYVERSTAEISAWFAAWTTSNPSKKYLF